MKALKYIGITLLSILIIALVAMGIAAAVCVGVTKDYQLQPELLKDTTTHSVILDRENYQIDNQKIHYTPYDQISEPILSTFVAVEDKRFYEHKGVDGIRIMGAMWDNIKSGRFKEGASTISQQLIKNTHLSNEKTIKRKLIEIKLAKQLEKQYTKEQILEMYLNKIYFGSGIYGIYDACLAFFGKAPKDINLAEATILTGVVKNPRKNSPIINIEGAKARQKQIFGILEKQGKIDKNTLNEAKNYNIVIKNSLNENNFASSYIKNTLFQASQILDMPEKDLMNNGYNIHTFCDQNLQAKLQNIASSYSFDNDLYYSYSIMNNHTRGVSAYIDNTPLCYSQIKRQPGSTMKPFSVYLPAITNNTITPLTMIEDSPINIGGYSPSNFNNIYHGKVTITDSVIHSYNIPAVKVLQQVGLDNSISLLDRFHFDIEDKDKNLSIALGTNSVYPLQLSDAYCTLANYGEYKSASFIDTITTEDGKLIYDSAQVATEQVADKDSCFIMTDILTKTSKTGTAHKLSDFDFDIASKTGTVATDKGNSDGWCASFTPDHTVVVWHGEKDTTLDNTHMGGGYPTLITKEIYRNLYGEGYNSFFCPTDNVVQCKIDKQTLDTESKEEILDKDTDREYYTEYLKKDNLNHIYTEKNDGLPYTIERDMWHNKIIFYANGGSEYQIYRLDGDKQKLLTTITANGDMVQYIDNDIDLFGTFRYKIIKVN